MLQRVGLCRTNGYGYDLSSTRLSPFFFSVNVPYGNYLVTVTLGSSRQAGSTTVRGENRRLFLENVATRKGEFLTYQFTINKRAFVHYPAGTYPNQDKPLEDNTHFNPYGAYQIAKCIIEGMKQFDLPLTEYLREDYQPYSPAHLDDPDTFHWNDSPFFDLQKPQGN